MAEIENKSEAGGQQQEFLFCCKILRLVQDSGGYWSVTF